MGGVCRYRSECLEDKEKMLQTINTIYNSLCIKQILSTDKCNFDAVAVLYAIEFIIWTVMANSIKNSKCIAWEKQQKIRTDIIS